MATPTCVVVGVGPGNGAAFARTFAREGYRVGLLARSRDTIDALAAELPGSVALACDVRDPAAIEGAFRQLREKLGPVDVLVYNAGSGVFEDFDKTTTEALESAWRTNTLGLFVSSRAVAPDMRARGGGNIVVVGATASLRGGANFLPFASAKAAQRSVAQSMARKLWPEGIHVSYLILDGAVDIPRTRKMMPDKPDEFFLDPEAIATEALHVVRQPRRAWTFELDLRPHGEKW